jgi:hypothetical protein
MTLEGGVQAERMGCPIQEGARGGQRGGDAPRALGGIRARQVSSRGQTLRALCNGEGRGHQIVHGVKNKQRAHPGSAHGCNGVETHARDQLSRFNVG